MPALRARGSCIPTELRVPECARNAEQLSCTCYGVNINTRDLDNLEIHNCIFCLFIIFSPSIILTIRESTFCFGLYCKNDKVISKIEIKHAD